MTMYEDFGTGKPGKEGLGYVAEELGLVPPEGKPEALTNGA